MNDDLLNRLIQGSSQAAAAQQVPITIAIVDTGGHLVGLHRQAECSYFALETSRKKAVTASQLGMPSKVVGEIGQKFPALQASFSTNAEISGLPGGLPIRLNGLVVGGIGIAGGNFEQDQSIAEATVHSIA